MFFSKILLFFYLIVGVSSNLDAKYALRPSCPRINWSGPIVDASGKCFGFYHPDQP